MNIIFLTKNWGTGRLPRSIFWIGYAWILLISLTINAMMNYYNAAGIGHLVSLLLYVFLLNAEVKRLHDVGKSGIFLIIFFIIAFYAVLMFILSMCLLVDNFMLLTPWLILGASIILSTVDLVVMAVFLLSKSEEDNKYRKRLTPNEYMEANQ